MAAGAGEGWAQQFLSVSVTAAVGIVTAAATFFAGRRQGKASIISAIQGAAHLAIKDLKDLCDILRDELGRVRTELAELRQIRDEIARERAKCEAELAHFRAELERAMGQPIAPYQPGNVGANRGDM